MIRCVTLTLSLLASAVPAMSQLQRQFPPDALRGELVVLQPPEARLNGRPARLAPGARIRDDMNLLVVSGALSGRPLAVHYTLDPTGLLQNIWVLTPAELARGPWPTTRQQAGSWVFDPTTQAWSRP